MKQSRRQELRTNDLSVYLDQILQFAQQNIKYIIGGLAIIVLILVVNTVTSRNEAKALAEGERAYKEFAQADVTPDGKLLERVSQLAGQYRDDETLGAKILELQARMANDLALSLGQDEKERKVELLKEARDIYKALPGRLAGADESVTRAHYSLARIEESLALLGESDVESVRKLYQAVIDGPTSPFQELASDAIETLEDRLGGLTLAASRPAADTQPAEIVLTSRPAKQMITITPTASQPAAQ